MDIYIAHLQGIYSEALPTPERQKRTVLRLERNACMLSFSCNSLMVISVRCDVPQQCSMPETTLLRDDMRTEVR